VVAGTVPIFELAGAGFALQCRINRFDAGWGHAARDSYAGAHRLNRADAEHALAREENFLMPEVRAMTAGALDHYRDRIRRVVVTRPEHTKETLGTHNRAPAQLGLGHTTSSIFGEMMRC
jgi:hypothetical protein